MKILNLYAGIGGNRKLWGDEHGVTAVELNPEIAEAYQTFFPNDKVFVADAHGYLLEHFKKYDFIWSSPPCPSHSVCNHFLKGQGIYRFPDMKLYEEILFLKHMYEGLYCVENVKPYYEPLIIPQYIGRHAFWSNFLIPNINVDHDVGTMNRNASKAAQRKAAVKEGVVPGFLKLHNLKAFKIKNKIQVLRNCVLPKVGEHILNYAINPIETQQSLF